MPECLSILNSQAEVLDCSMYLDTVSYGMNLARSLAKIFSPWERMVKAEGNNVPFAEYLSTIEDIL